MRYQMKQKFWSWGKQYAIRDADSVERFLVKGEVFTLGQKLSFCDPAGQELIYIRQRLLSWGPTFELDRHAEGSTSLVQKHWTFFKDRFTVDITADGPSPDDLDLSGDFWSHEYAFSRGVGGPIIAQVSKRWFSWTDVYGVDIAPGEDDVLILACTVVVDLCLDRRKQSNQ